MDDAADSHAPVRVSAFGLVPVRKRLRRGRRKAEWPRRSLGGTLERPQVVGSAAPELRQTHRSERGLVHLEECLCGGGRPLRATAAENAGVDRALGRGPPLTPPALGARSAPSGWSELTRRWPRCPA